MEAEAPCEVVLTLPYPLSANRYWASRVAKINGVLMPLTYVTADAKAYKQEVAWLAKAAGVRKPMLGRVGVDIQLYPMRPADWAKRAAKDPAGWDDTVRCIDLDNARKVLYDALKGVVFEDDKWVRQDSAARMEPDGEARVVVTVRRIAPATLPQASLL
jgi:crossover junction endodeoxyribonuclease RusA